MIGKVEVNVQLFDTHGLEYLLCTMRHITSIRIRLQFQFEGSNEFIRAKSPKMGLLTI